MTLDQVEQLHEALQQNKSYFGVKRSKPVRDPHDSSKWGLEIEYEYEIPPESAELQATRKGNVEIAWHPDQALLIFQSLHARAGTHGA